MEAVGSAAECGGPKHDMNGLFTPVFAVYMAVDVDIGPRNTEGVTAATPQISLNPSHATMLAI